MTKNLRSDSIPIEDLKKAIQFLQQSLSQWRQQGKLSAEAEHRVNTYYSEQLKLLNAGNQTDTFNLPPETVCYDCKKQAIPHQDHCFHCGSPVVGDNVTRLRYLVLACHEIKKLAKSDRLPLSASHDLMADCNAQIIAIRKALDQSRIPFAEVAEPEPPPPPVNVPKQQTAPPTKIPDPPPKPFLDILLDPRNIQWLLAIGGVLLVLGIVIYLAASGFFQEPLNAAIVLGVGNGLILAGGWVTMLRTRHQMAGRALTLLACLAMPLNLWFYSAQGLITVEGGGLWIPAVFLCVLYAISGRVLKDPAFVYALVGGIILTGLLILANENLERFWQITIPSTMLVVLGLICIHLERAFPPEEGDFSRKRFGLAFFWSGHLSLGAGLLLLLGAQLAGGPFYEPIFEEMYKKVWNVERPEVAYTFQGKLLALVLILVGTYAYIYSDLVVRKIGLYISLAALTFLWAETLCVTLLPIDLNPVEVAIVTLSLTGLIINLVTRTMQARQAHISRWAEPLGLFLSIVPVVLGVYLYFTIIPQYFPSSSYRLTWSYVVAMVITAIVCRIGAHFRRDSEFTQTTYLFGTGAALMVGLVGLLMVVNPEMTWIHRAPLVILLPIVYLLAGRLYRDRGPERAMYRVAHAGVVVMLISSLSSVTWGFTQARMDLANIYLAIFFIEVAVFYALEAAFRPHQGILGIEGSAVYGAALMLAAAVWQVLAYYGVGEQVYILGFAGVGLVLLICYRFTVLEKVPITGLAAPAFWAGSVLLLLGSVSGGLRTLNDLIPARAAHGNLGETMLLPVVLALFSLIALCLVRETNWRRVYVVSTIAQTGLAVLTLAVLSTLTFWEKVETVLVLLGMLLLITGHVGLFREKDRHDDLISFTLILGCLLAAIPLMNATMYCRVNSDSFDTFHAVNEAAMLIVGLLLLASGFMFQIKSTTLTGAVLSTVWLVTLVLYLRLPERLQSTAIYLMIGGGAFFGTGILLSIYRDRLLALPEKIKRREGLFRVLSWR